MTESKWFFRRGELARDGWEARVDATLPGWTHTGLDVAALEPGQGLELGGTGVERLIIPLAGSFTVGYSHGGEATTQELAGRPNVFDAATDVLFLNAQTTGTITATAGEGRVAIATAPASEPKPNRYLPVEEYPVEMRGAGGSSREVRNYGTPAALDAEKFIVCEVLTPSENWSSYPPHKHDEDKPGHESRLEEIYYFEARPTTGASDAVDPQSAFGMFSTYTSSAGKIEVDARVFSGDIALVPYGYHGPAVAAPGYDLYYLNVMAGPDPERVWLISDDPAYGWVRETWEGLEFDSRLPLGKNLPQPTNDQSQEA
ncbi:5-deoxy-glucuronate isomerase [Galactobacter sp.]|uniref:5-deoxy-glucuronate isomerase n=1 Tax=Galactobacter sp. TaxID=2676125 RepID=UPI0025BFD2B3|nr:5-deoxy-glucuronate isomerase [Galactobacter sp.]